MPVQRRGPGRPPGPTFARDWVGVHPDERRSYAALAALMRTWGVQFYVKAYSPSTHTWTLTLTRRYDAALPSGEPAQLIELPGWKRGLRPNGPRPGAPVKRAYEDRTRSYRPRRTTLYYADTRPRDFVLARGVLSPVRPLPYTLFMDSLDLAAGRCVDLVTFARERNLHACPSTVREYLHYTYPYRTLASFFGESRKSWRARGAPASDLTAVPRLLRLMWEARALDVAADAAQAQGAPIVCLT